MRIGNPGGYENAPATLLLDLRCVVCNRPLVDAKSASVCIGPVCAVKVGLDRPLPEEVREEANKLIHDIAHDPENYPAVEAMCRRLEEIGLEVLADRILERIAKFLEELRRLEEMRVAEERRRKEWEEWEARQRVERQLMIDAEARKAAAARERDRQRLEAERIRRLEDEARRRAEEERRRTAALLPEVAEESDDEDEEAYDEPSPPPDLDARIEAWLGEGGILAGVIPGYRVRPQQLVMAKAVARTRGVAIIEAPCGVGKSMGYLVPAVLSGRKVLVATGNIALQEQLVGKDLPTIGRAAAAAGIRPPTFALVKGRGNYLCLHRLKRSAAPKIRLVKGLAVGSGMEVNDARNALEAWAANTSTGDRTEWEGSATGSGIPWAEADAEWGRVCGLSDGCKSCDGVCFYRGAQQEAARADIVVTNHHQLWTWGRIPQQRVLATRNFLVVDEAHKLADHGRAALGFTVSPNPSRVLVQEIADAWATHWATRPRPTAADGRTEAERFRDDYAAMHDALLEYARDPRYDKIRLRGPLALDEIRVVIDHLDLVHRVLAGQHEAAERAGDVKVCRMLEALMRMVGGLQGRLVRVHDGDPDLAIWLDVKEKDKVEECRVEARQVDVSAEGKAMLARFPGAVLTSATLATHEGFKLLCRELGIDQAHKLQLGTPFDLGRQAVLWRTRISAPPNGDDYAEEVAGKVGVVAGRLGGRTLVLCTSYRMMRFCAAWLRRRFPEWRILQQQDASRTQLVEDLRSASMPTVLLGVATMWEGVDVPGDALQAVVVAKLPFPSPADPLIDALSERAKERTGDGFRDESLPRAVLAFRQGIGRLIRTETDRGILLVLDDRIWTKQYGKAFVSALGPIPVALDLDSALASVGLGKEA